MKTSISLDQSSSEQIAQSLSQILADTYITYIKTQNFHWNLEDTRFHSLHQMFEQLYTQLAENIDELAERMRMLKLKAPGSMRQFLDIATLEESDAELTGDQMLHDLCHDRETLIKHIRPKIDEATKFGDQGSADLLTQQLRLHEKAAWMLRSHINGELI